jgi:hypothetical protein
MFFVGILTAIYATLANPKPNLPCISGRMFVRVFARMNGCVHVRNMSIYLICKSQINSLEERE